jgi:hypothetical protein
VSDEVVINRRFRGPPDSANGGFACGTLAAHVDGDAAVEVTLHAPPPLDTPMSVEPTAEGARLVHGEMLVAAAVPANDPGSEVPPPVSVERAIEASHRAPIEDHPFPGCFVCGPERTKPDGLGVVCGPVPERERELIAAPFATDDWMAGPDGAVRPELVWAALDCPSGISSLALPETMGLSVLGRLTARLLEPVAVGPTYPVIGWPIERDGRKYHSASAVLSPEGEPLAVARATWIELRDQPAGHEQPA